MWFNKLFLKKYTLLLILWCLSLPIWASSTVLDHAQDNVEVWGAHVYAAFVAAAVILGIMGGMLVVLRYLDGDYRSTKTFLQLIFGLAVLGFVGYILNFFLSDAPAPHAATVDTSGVAHTGQINNGVGTAIGFTMPIPPTVNSYAGGSGNAIQDYIDANSAPLPQGTFRAMDTNRMKQLVIESLIAIVELSAGFGHHILRNEAMAVLADAQAVEDTRGLAIDLIREQQGMYGFPKRGDFYNAAFDAINDRISLDAHDEGYRTMITDLYLRNDDRFKYYSRFWMGSATTEMDIIATPPVPSPP